MQLPSRNTQRKKILIIFIKLMKIERQTTQSSMLSTMFIILNKFEKFTSDRHQSVSFERVKNGWGGEGRGMEEGVEA